MEIGPLVLLGSGTSCDMGRWSEVPPGGVGDVEGFNRLEYECKAVKMDEKVQAIRYDEAKLSTLLPKPQPRY